MFLFNTGYQGPSAECRSTLPLFGIHRTSCELTRHGNKRAASHSAAQNKEAGPNLQHTWAFPIRSASRRLFLSFLPALLVSSELESFSASLKSASPQAKVEHVSRFSETQLMYGAARTLVIVSSGFLSSLDTEIIASRTAIFHSSQNMLTLSTEQLVLKKIEITLKI